MYYSSSHFIDGIVKHIFLLLYNKSNFKVEILNRILYQNEKLLIKNDKLKDIEKLMQCIDEQFKKLYNGL